MSLKLGENSNRGEGIIEIKLKHYLIFSLLKITLNSLFSSRRKDTSNPIRNELENCC